MNTKKYDLVLFDLDGTISDSKIGITKSVQYALKHFGINEPDLDKLKKFIGPPLWESFMIYYAMNESDANHAVEKYREYYSVKGIYENAVYPGIPEMLERLRSVGRILALATSKPTVFAQKVLEHSKLDEYFSIIIGSNLDGTHIEKAEIIKSVLMELESIEKEKVVMVGDRKHDIIGANEAGVDSIGVLYGFGSKEELSSYIPTYIVESVAELERILINL